MLQQIFAYVLNQCINNRLVENHTYFIYSTHVKASANKHKLEEKKVTIPPKVYQEVLEVHVEKTREVHGKRPLKKNSKRRK
jgi:predicted nucleic acid-binding protein